MLHSVDELMAIGEFSERSGLSVSRLRSYATEGLLVPVAVDPASGYRYYAPAQLCDARVIDALRDAGMPLAEIGALLRHPTSLTLDSWERRIESDRAQSRESLRRARDLLGMARPRVPTSTAVLDSKGASMTRFETAARSEIGPVRMDNEDVVVTTDRLAVVADGMGGAPGGATAASDAGRVLQAIFTGRSLDELVAAVRAANWMIWNRACGQTDLSGMGTTICAAGVFDDGAVGVVNVGDSRAYLWHGGHLTRLTKDHSITADLVERGQLRDDDAPGHPHYGVLTRALGVGPEVEVDGAVHDVSAGDRLVLCSDGLSNELSDDEIVSVLAKNETVTASADDLVGRALEAGGRDNVSVVVAQVGA
jgi:PPM family protein phosphatase